MVNVVGWAVPGSDDAGKGSAAGNSCAVGAPCLPPSPATMVRAGRYDDAFDLLVRLAGGRAERRVVVEDFEKAGLWTEMRLRRSLSTVVRSVPSSPGETPPFQTHSSLASAEGRPRNLAPSSSFWANPPRAQQGPDGRPALSRATTWRTSAPRLAHEDSKEDLDV